MQVCPPHNCGRRTLRFRRTRNDNQPVVVFVPSHDENMNTCPVAKKKHTPVQDLAKADTEVFDEDGDGMFARVEAPSMNLLRVWVCVQPWRLFEGMAHTTAVEALGLDPNKGVMVSPVCCLRCVPRFRKKVRKRRKSPQRWRRDSLDMLRYWFLRLVLLSKIPPKAVTDCIAKLFPARQRPGCRLSVEATHLALNYFHFL